MSQEILENFSDEGRATRAGTSIQYSAGLTLSLSGILALEDDMSFTTSSRTDHASSDNSWPTDESFPNLSSASANGTTIVDRPAVYQYNYSTVYKGTRAGTTVAIQATRGFIPNPIVNQELENVRKRWFHLDNKNVQKLLGVGICAELSPYACTVSPWYEKGTVSDFMRTSMITDNQRLDLMQGLTSGIAHLHSLNPPFVHGTLNPNNVLVDGNNEAIICDLDSTHNIRNELSKAMADTALINASIRYIARELVSDVGCPVPTVQSDTWSLACLLYEIAYSKLPYAHDESQGPGSCLQILTKLNSGHPPAKRPSGLSKQASQFWKVVLEPSWNVHPNKRPTAAIISQYLEERGTGILV